jgi:6-phosphogluconolactonase
MTIQVFPDPESLSQAAADLFVRAAQEAVASNGRFAVALSGGHSPRQTHRMLAQSPYCEQVPWDKVHIFWGDERCVPEGDPRHNATVAFGDLIKHVPVKKDQVHPILCEKSPRITAERYDSLLRGFFEERTTSCDVIFLGLGEDGHTASLFPNNPVLNESKRWAKEVFAPEQEMYRVTLTPAFINRGAMVVFLVYGEGKARVLREVLEGQRRPLELPAQIINPVEGKLLWFVDESAASMLTTTGH